MATVITSTNKILVWNLKLLRHQDLDLIVLSRQRKLGQLQKKENWNKQGSMLVLQIFVTYRSSSNSISETLKPTSFEKVAKVRILVVQRKRDVFSDSSSCHHSVMYTTIQKGLDNAWLECRLENANQHQQDADSNCYQSTFCYWSATNYTPAALRKRSSFTSCVPVYGVTSTMTFRM